MNIPKGEILRLKRSRENLFIHDGIEIEKGNFWLATTIEEPIKPVLLKVRLDSDGKIEAYKYDGEDCEEILKEFLKK